MTGNRAAIVLAGGAGTRLWPLSTEQRPKQFLELFEGRSLLQRTVTRLARSFGSDNLFISTQSKYRELVLEQLPGMDPERILLEPTRRNTAPAIATATASVAQRLGDPVVGIFPADHYIRDDAAFDGTIESAIDFASRETWLVTLAIEATRPETGFGYLELGDPIGQGVFRVTRFVEKPDAERARQFIASGRHAWNAGMFLWRPSIMRDALRETDAELDHLVTRWTDATVEHRDTIYATMPSISIDYALMEKAGAVAAVKGDFGWSDVGSWKAVAELSTGESSGGVVIEGSSNAFVHSTVGRPLLVLGAEGVAVIDTPEGLLVLNLEQTDMLKAAVEKLTERSRQEES